MSKSPTVRLGLARAGLDAAGKCGAVSWTSRLFADVTLSYDDVVA